MDDNFFYRDLTGKRHLRSYLKASILIVIFMGLVVVYALWQRAQMRAEVFAPARPVAWEPTPTPIPPTATPTATPEPFDELRAAPCPSNPSDWTFFYPYPGYDGNLHKIKPACVYEGLERTVAWALLTGGMGYNGIEAAEALGFAEMPFKPVRTLKIMTDFKGPMEMGMKNPYTYPTIRHWQVTDDGAPSVEFALRGCFRARSIVGLQVDEWGLYPVMCIVSGDAEGQHLLAEQEPHRYRSDKNTPARALFVFGYAGAGQWNIIGYQKQPILRLSDMNDPQADREFMAGSHGVSVWNAAWVESAFGIPQRPLFDGWQTHVNSDEDKAAISRAVKEFRENGYTP